MKICFISIVATIVLFIVGCDKDDEIKDSDTYIFLEQHSHEFSEHISGPEPPVLMIDFPTYSYDSETKTLNGIIDFDISKDLKLIYGSGICLSGDAGGGCGTGLSGIYGIPYERDGFELLKADTDGSIVALYNDVVVDLDAGQEWINETIRYDTTQIEGQNSIVKITHTNKITNYGILNKSDIIEWSWE